MWRNGPAAPNPPDHRKERQNGPERLWPISLSASSIPNSQAIRVSSLLSPLCRSSPGSCKEARSPANRFGRGSQEVEQDLEPLPRTFGAALLRTPRARPHEEGRSTGPPHQLCKRRERGRVASPTEPSSPAAPIANARPPAMYRLPATRSTVPLSSGVQTFAAAAARRAEGSASITAT